MNKTSTAYENELTDAERTSGKCACGRPAGHPGNHRPASMTQARLDEAARIAAALNIEPETNLDLIQIERND